MRLLLIAFVAIVAGPRKGPCPPADADPCFEEQAAVCRDESLKSARLERDKRALEQCRKDPPTPTPPPPNLPPWRKR